MALEDRELLEKIKDSLANGLGGSATDNAAAPSTGTLTTGKYNSSAPTYDNGDAAYTQMDVNGNTKVSLATLIAGEDLTNGVLKVEKQYTNSGVKTADAQIKASAGFVHTITFSPNDAVPTAGSIILYDNTAESGTQIFNWNVQATAFIPFTVTLDVVATTGLYLGFTTTADVNVTVSYR